MATRLIKSIYRPQPCRKFIHYPPHWQEGPQGYYGHIGHIGRIGHIRRNYKALIAADMSDTSDVSDMSDIALLFVILAVSLGKPRTHHAFADATVLDKQLLLSPYKAVEQIASLMNKSNGQIAQFLGVEARQ